MPIESERMIAFYMAAVVTIVIVGSLTVLHEIDPGLKALLDAITGHHWVTKSLLVAVLFPTLSAVFYFLVGREYLRRRSDGKGIMAWTWVAVAATLVYTLGVFLYYALHYLGVL